MEMEAVLCPNIRLQECVAKNDKEGVEAILDHQDNKRSIRDGLQIKAANVLYIAIDQGNIAIIETLLKNIKDPLEKCENLEKGSYVLKAVEKSRFDILETLIKYKFKIDVIGINKPLPLTIAIRKNNTEIARLLIEKSYDATYPKHSKIGKGPKNKVSFVNYFSYSDKNTALHFAAADADSDIFEAVLEKAQKDDLYKKNMEGKTPIDLTFESGCKEKASLLLGYLKEDIKFLHTAAAFYSNDVLQAISEKDTSQLLDYDSFGVAPLHVAIIHNQVDKVKTLKEMGNNETAKIIDQNNTDTMPAYLKNFNLKSYNGYTPLQLALSLKDTSDKIIYEFIYSKSIDAKKQFREDKGKTLIHYTAIGGSVTNFRIVAVKLKAIGNFKLNQQIHETKKTAIMIAIENNNTDLALELINQKCDLSIADIDGENPLHKAVRKNNHDVIMRILKTKDININTKNNQGETAKSLAKKANKKTYKIINEEDKKSFSNKVKMYLSSFTTLLGLFIYVTLSQEKVLHIIIKYKAILISGLALLTIGTIVDILLSYPKQEKEITVTNTAGSISSSTVRKSEEDLVTLSLGSASLHNKGKKNTI